MSHQMTMTNNELESEPHSTIANWLIGSNSYNTESSSVSEPIEKPVVNYENCIMLQASLGQGARFGSIGNLLRQRHSLAISNDLDCELRQASCGSPMRRSESLEQIIIDPNVQERPPDMIAKRNIGDDDDADYAATSVDDASEQTNCDAENVSVSSLSASDGEQERESLYDDDDEAHDICHQMPPIAANLSKQCKEILVKIVIDDSEPTTGGCSEVFYINPIVSF